MKRTRRRERKKKWSRRKVLRKVAYSAPVILGSFLLGRPAHASHCNPAPTCAPHGNCGPGSNPCGPKP